MVEPVTNPYYRSLLDAIPLAIFVMDDQMRILDSNRAAAEAFGLDGSSAPGALPGDVLHCLYAQDSPGVCGGGAQCQTCVIRNSVDETFLGRQVTRKRMKLERLADSEVKYSELLITTSPIPGDERLTLLMVEDISEITRLHEIIPICSKCKQVRDDRQFWQKVESYFHEHIGVDFTHGLCPGCVKELYPDI